jgi:hypothetical protein
LSRPLSRHADRRRGATSGVAPRQQGPPSHPPFNVTGWRW